MADKISFANLTIEIAQSDLEVVYRFNGDVDENFRQQDVPRIKRPSIILELEGVRNFNSVGIREWIYMIRDICALGSVKFRRCSVTMIDQINMVPDSLGSGTIESLYAPYFCETDGETSQLIGVKDHLAMIMNRQAPEFKCDKCSQKLVFDALEESYFLFADDNSIKAAS